MQYHDKEVSIFYLSLIPRPVAVQCFSFTFIPYLGAFLSFCSCVIGFLSRFFLHHNHHNPWLNVQCPIASSLGEVPSYWDWLWCPGLSPILMSIALPFAFHTCSYLPLDFNRVSSLCPTYCAHLVDLSLTHSVGEFPGLGLALVPDVVALEAEFVVV